MTLHRDVEKRRGRRQAGRQRQWSRAQERDRQPLSAAAAQCSPWLASPVATHSGTHCRSPLFRVSPGRARRRGTGSLRPGKTSNHDRPAARRESYRAMISDARVLCGVRDGVRSCRGRRLGTARVGMAPAAAGPLRARFLRSPAG
jgi:hypothetical protein